jgi:hypothetical protein
MGVKPVLKISGVIVAAGFLFGVGVRLSQWLVPAPPVEIALCGTAGEPGSGPDTCLVVEDDESPAASLLEQDAAPMLAPPSTKVI